jgi:hypothetical protein
MVVHHGRDPLPGARLDQERSAVSWRKHRYAIPNHNTPVWIPGLDRKARRDGFQSPQDLSLAEKDTLTVGSDPVVAENCERILRGELHPDLPQQAYTRIMDLLDFFVREQGTLLELLSISTPEHICQAQPVWRTPGRPSIASRRPATPIQQKRKEQSREAICPLSSEVLDLARVGILA